MRYFALAKPYPTALCAAEPGEPLRGVTLTTEQGLPRHYLIGALSHRAADYALVVNLPVTRTVVEAALARSVSTAFPGHVQDAEDLAEIRELLDLAAQWPMGTLLRIVNGHFELEEPNTPRAARAALLADVTTAMLRALAPAAPVPVPVG